jgi:hypothetical protein
VARKVTMAIVAMPIVIVTSWVLYQRRKLYTYHSCSCPLTWPTGLSVEKK